MGQRGRLALAAGLWCSVALLAAAQAAGLLSGVDHAIFRAVYSPSPAWRLVSLTASTPVVAGYYAAWLLYDLYRAGRAGYRLVSSAAAMVLALASVAVLKAAVQAPRPLERPLRRGFPEALLHADYYSFPSGHAAKATVLAATLGRGRGGVVEALLWAWAAAVYASRLVLGAHWLFDVAASVLLGLACVETVELLAPYWARLYCATLGRLRPLRMERCVGR